MSLESLNRKHILLIVALSIILLIIPYQNNEIYNEERLNVVDNSIPAYGESWLVGFQYRERMIVYKAAGSGPNYQIKMTVTLDVADGADDTTPPITQICTESNGQVNFGDIRFTDSTGDGELHYWMETKTDGVSAIFWIEVSEDLSTTSRVIYIYYGTEGLSTTTSSGANTFLFYEDWDSETVDAGRWDEITGDGSITFSGSGQSTVATVSGGTGTATQHIETDLHMSAPYAVRFRSSIGHTTSSSQRTSQGLGTVWGTAGVTAMIWSDAATHVFRGVDDDINVDDQTMDAAYLGSYFTYDITMDSTTAKLYVDSTLRETASVDPSTMSQNVGIIYVRDSEYDVLSDWMICRKYVATEPYVSNLYDEEIATVSNVDADITNADDSNRLYAQMRIYTIETSSTMQSGWTNIDTVEIFLETSTPTIIFALKYDQGTDTFSKVSGTITLATGSCSDSGSGMTLDLTFAITIPWAHTDYDELDMRMVTTDDFSEDDEDNYDTWDIETRIIDDGPLVLDDGSGTINRGNYDTIGGIEASGRIDYIGSALHPPTTAIDVYINCISGTPVTHWEATNYNAVSGTFSVDVDSDDVVGQDTYYLYAVEEGGEWDDSNLIYGGDPNEDYIADRIVVDSYDETDTRVNVNEEINLFFGLSYDYDDEPVTTGTITLNGESTINFGSGNYYMSITRTTVTDFECDTVAGSDSANGITKFDQNEQSEILIWDRVNFDFSATQDWSVVDCNITIDYTAIYEYDSEPFVGSVSWANHYPVESVVDLYEYGSEVISSITDSSYGLTVFSVTDIASVVFDSIEFTSGPNYYWSQETEERVWFIWGVASAYEWSYNISPVQNGFLIQSIVNGTNNAYATTYGGSIGGLAIGVFDPEYYSANITITIAVGAYVITLWYQTVTVDILHSLQMVNFNIEPTDYYFWIVYQTNLMNASITIWDDVVDAGTLFADSIYHSNSEGMHQIPIDDTAGDHHYTICITSYATHYDKTFDVDYYVWWYNFTNVVPIDVSIYETNVVIIDNLGRVIDFNTFVVYKNGTRIYSQTTITYSNYAYNITIVDRWGETLNSTVFTTGDYEFVLVVEVYSLKIMSWYEDFVFFNITHGGLTYIEVITPLDTIEFELYTGTYDWEVDYRNGTTIQGQTILTDSTAIIVTGSTIADILGYSADLLDMTTQINVTLTSTTNQILTISVDLTNINTTINEQLIYVLLNITNTDSLIGQQTIDILAELQNVNSTLYNQTVDIILDLSYISSNVTAGFISVAADLLAIDSNLYSNFTSVTATLSLIDSSLLSNFTEIVATLTAINSEITSNYISLTATLAAIDSNLLSNFTSVAATLSLIDSNLLSNFTEVTATLSAIGTNITSNYLSVASTLSALDSNLLSNFTSVSAALTLIDSNLLSNFTSVTSTLSAIGSNVTANYLSVIAELALLDSSLLSNFTSVSATLSLIDSNMLSNFTSVTSTLSAIGSNITSNYLNVAATLLAMDSSIYSNFTSIVSTLSTIGTDITTNYLALSTTLSLIDSSLLSNFTNIIAQIVLVDSAMYSNFTAIVAQIIDVTTNLAELNATIYLIDDPTHLNPLVLGYSLSDDYCDFTIINNWHNATLSIYDNDVLRTGPTSELLCPIRYPLLTLSGTHNLSVFVDGGTDSYWYNISYTVAEVIAFEIVDWDVSPHFGVENYLELSFETTWENGTIYTYMNGTLQSSVLEQYGGVTYVLWMPSGSGLHQYVFNVTSGTNVITLTWNLYVPDWADTGLVMWFDIWTYQNNYTLLTLESNWHNCTFYVYLNGSIVATSAVDPVTLNITRSINTGIYNLTIVADGGTQIVTISNIRYIVTEEGVSYDYSTVTGGVQYVTHEGDVENTTIVYPDDTTKEDTVLQIMVNLVAIIFGVVILVSIAVWWKDKKFAEREYALAVAGGGRG